MIVFQQHFLIVTREFCVDIVHLIKFVQQCGFT